MSEPKGGARTSPPPVTPGKADPPEGEDTIPGMLARIREDEAKEESKQWNLDYPFGPDAS